jgi:cysteine desulfurase/selenocysteine lyase
MFTAGTKTTLDIRKDFPMLSREGFAYLDSAASSQTPEPVLAAMDAYYRECRANVHRGMYATSEEATDRYEAARAKVAAFIGARTDEVVFARGTTEAMNLLAYSIGSKLGPGDEVLMTVMEHHANLVPWQQLAIRHGFTVKFIPMGADYRLDMTAAEAMLGPQTKVVSVIHASNVLGTINPVKRLAEIARAKSDALVIVDAAQTAGHIGLNVRSIDCDFLAFSGHKMLGPTGIGVLYGKRERLAALDPFLYGGDMIGEVTFASSTWNVPPQKFEAGTPNIAGAIGLGAAVDYITRVGQSAITAHEEEMTAYALAQLKSAGAVIYGPDTTEDRVGAISFGVGSIHPHDLSTILDLEGVCVRGGHHCAMPLVEMLGVPGTTRASVGPYTTRQDIDALIRGIARAKTVFRV